MNKIPLNIQKFANADGKVVIETLLDKTGFEKGLNKIQSIAKTGFKGIGTAVGAVSAAMGAALTNGVKFNSQIEQLQTSFEVMTGSADKATEIIQKLKDVGAKTPYELKGLAKTTQLLMQYGFSADDAYNATINLGDIAQGNAEKMESIALAFGQMSSLGKVTMQDIKQMINAGFNPLQAIAEMTGETMQQVNARYEEGAISVEEVTKAMQYASSENGKFYKSMEKQSKTLAGQISTLKDNFDSLTGTLSEGLSKTISGEVLPSINDLLQNMEKAFTENGIGGLAEAVGQGISNMLTAIVKEAPKFLDIALLIVQNLIQGIQNNLSTISQSAVQLASNFISSLLNMLPEITKFGMNLIIELATGISQQLPILIPQAIDIIITMYENLIDNVDLFIDAALALIIGLAEGLITALPKLIEKVPILIDKLVTKLTDPEMLGKIIQAGARLITELALALIMSIPSLLKSVVRLKDTILNGLSNIVKSMGSIGGNIVSGIWQGISNSLSWIKNKISGWVGNVVNFIRKIFKIGSPSKLMRDKVGIFVAQGIGVGFEDELDSVYNDMQHALDIENAKIQASVESGKIFNSLVNSTPISISLDGSVEMDNQKVGRIITPVVARTIKTGGGN